MTVHIGKLIKQTIEERGMSVSEFARRINTSRENVYGIFKRQSVDTTLLQKAGKVLEKDFFEYYHIKESIPVFKDTTVTYRKKNTTENIESIQQKLQMLQNEMAALKKELQLKDKIIALMEQKVVKAEKR